MSPIRLTRNSIALTAVLSAALALGGASTAEATTTTTYTPGVYLYTGNGVEVPVLLTMTGGKMISSVPAVIHTADGNIMVGEGPLPPGDGNRGQDYAGWSWTLTPTAAQLAWANLNSSATVIENVTPDFASSATIVTLAKSAFASSCMSYLKTPGNPNSAQWLHLDANYDWVPDTTPGC